MTKRRSHQTSKPGRPGYDLESLLDVAVMVFNKHGYDGTSMEMLSAKLGISKSSIYHHVSSKEELLDRALGRALNSLIAVTAEEGATSGAAIDRLEYVVRRTVDLVVADQAYVTLLLRVRGNTGVERRALARRRELDAFVGELVQRAADENDVRPGLHPALVSRLLFGTVNSIVEWHRPGDGRSSQELADSIVTIMFDGLRNS
ncbi:TetR/AcrR family transcriptional regulator [Rhodococcus opacus]|uniref:TetR family transcriptional regulator n=1 Tax=Rhodococcus opacus TaxID=37919 RepID=A0A2S8IYZ9_RHOOP|nr:TetR/AcrR family transcriptional regulator [Rhodococcus opacus]PQP20024.1 TetR family transcriptional regulator [Rhodococcus opacus]